MVWVHAGINYSNDASAVDAKAVLRILEPDDLCGGMGRITVPDYGVVGKLDRRRIVQRGWNARKRHLRDRQKMVRLDTDNPEERFHQGQRSVQKSRGSHKKG